MNVCTDCGHEVIDNSQDCEFCNCDEHDTSVETVEWWEYAI